MRKYDYSDGYMYVLTNPTSYRKYTLQFSGYRNKYETCVGGIARNRCMPDVFPRLL